MLNWENGEESIIDLSKLDWDWKSKGMELVSFKYSNGTEVIYLGIDESIKVSIKHNGKTQDVTLVIPPTDDIFESPDDLVNCNYAGLLDSIIDDINGVKK